MTLLLLKLTLVPAFILTITLAANRFGPKVGVWLGGLPVVFGPITLLIALEQGGDFARRAVVAGLAAMVAVTAFYVGYAILCLRFRWFAAQTLATLLWLGGALIAATVAHDLTLALIAATIAIAIGSALAPRVEPDQTRRGSAKTELAMRAAAGAALTLAATAIAEGSGAAAGGIIAMFPVVGSVMAIFSQRDVGAVYASAFLSGVARGLWSMLVFGTILGLMLRDGFVAGPFLIATFAMMVAHAAMIAILQKASLKRGVGA
jgi:hypothetical protein